MIGERILKYRAKHNISQIKMADLLGISTNMVHRYEHHVCEPTLKNKIRLNEKMNELESAKNGNDNN